MRILLLGLLLSSPSLAQDRPHVVFLVGESEYGSRETVPAFATEIGERLALKTTVLHSDMESQRLPRLDALDDADLIVLALRFRKANAAQLARLRRWFDAGRPAIALRTTSHAFAKHKNWFPPIFGGHYKAHAPNDGGTRTLALPDAAGHPVLRGVDRVMDMGHGGTCNTQPLAETTTTLMLGRTGDRPCEPVTWVNRYRPRSRLLYTSLGSRAHFEKRAFRTMLANGVLWCLERPVPAGGALGGEALPDPTAPMQPPPPPQRQAPEDASVLFANGASDGLLHWDPSASPLAIRVDQRAHTSDAGPKYREARWPVIDGALVARPGFGDVISKDKIGHHILHLDFLVPEDPAWVPDDFRGRGGVYLEGKVEVEIADSHGRPLSPASCGAIRGVKAPDADAARPAGVWQSLDVAYRHDPGEPARATVWLNGVRIHQDVTLPARTVLGFLEQQGGGSSGSAATPGTNKALTRGVLGPLRLQADSSRVRFANVWVSPLADVDHARLIHAFDEDAYDRGEEVYLRRCFECHGEGFKRDNPLARNFMKDPLKQGSDPHAMWRTLTYGSETMPPQTFLSPQERYDAVHYVREEFFKDENPTQYFAVTDAYLESLPIGIPPRETEKPAGVPKAPLRDYGPALASQLQQGVSSAFTVRAGHHVSVSYDLHRMGVAGAWFDAFLDLAQTQHLLHRGEGQAKAAGRPLHGLETWEWAHGKGEHFGDPKGHPPRAPLPSSMTRYLGHYYHQRKVVLSYEIDGRRVYEMPTADRNGDHVVISQTLRIEPGERDLLLCVGRRPRDRKGTHAILPLDLSVRPGVWEQDGAARGHIALAAGAGGALGVGPYIAAAAAGDLTDLEWEIDGDRLLLRLPSSDQPRVVRVMRRAGNGTVDLERFSNAVDLAQRQPVADPKDLTHGGPPRWGEPLVTTGDVAAESANGYALDRIRLPDPNPFNAWLRPSSLDFFADGTCALTTYGGDVWLVSG
ncbi:MAG: DUF1080 domain-containing protein, partial [Planctomycetes bacterium]|nr:DUF1080 domain-containing protein [Planctomycetota bacterium]